ncbi:hypothetical protein [Acidovorax sp. FJL06]|uniref:hypothetical protein n=1 Tax=Acidovorax sp. FJL06 TaxID=2153365 RepID=UPI000F56EE66|nr:hypothetical protein [Acidovorax sp. FJL06]RQO81368.1 hypothetical protein DBV10_14680 [Acidovorax sp. FJL06]
MLTEIEWWGGLIFVLGAITYKLVMGALDKKDEGIDWYRWQMHAFFLLPAVVLAGYFYPLARTELQYGYLGLLGASLAVVLVMLVQEITGDGPEDAEKKAAQAAKDDKSEREGEEEKEKEKKPQPAEEDEETGWLMTVVGALVLYSPVLVACGLGCTKVWPMVQRLL